MKGTSEIPHFFTIGIIRPQHRRAVSALLTLSAVFKSTLLSFPGFEIVPRDCAKYGSLRELTQVKCCSIATLESQQRYTQPMGHIFQARYFLPN